MTEPLRLRARVDAPLDEVRRALTDAAALRVWLAEHAETDLPDRYEFWGRYTPDGAAPHQRVLHADDRTIRLEWTVNGTATTAELAIEPETDTSTLISVSQSHVDWREAVQEIGLAVLSTFWSLAIANLVAYLEGRELPPRCDYSTREMDAHIDIAATPARVWEALMDPDIFQRWFGARMEVEPHVGGRWAMGGFDSGAEHAKIVELTPERRVTMEFHDMVSTWELEGAAGKTRLTFVQSGFDEPPYAGWAGWLGGVAELRRFLEMPDWRPMWLHVEMPGVPADMITIERGPEH
jgi:uncharacterized protein YndB with AHSA1/START domain